MQRDKISSLACVLVIIVILFHILVFADVNVLFYKADTQNADAIKKVLRRLCPLSGHEVNYWESSIFFDKLVPSSLQHPIVSILEIHNKGGQGTYINLPCPISRSKKKCSNLWSIGFGKSLMVGRKKFSPRLTKWCSLKPSLFISCHLSSFL